MTASQSAIDIIVQRATENVMAKGIEDTSINDLVLMVFGEIRRDLRFLVKNSQNGTGNNLGGKMDKARRMGTPALAGGGFLAIFLTILERVV
jgi:hypothetical protein